MDSKRLFMAAQKKLKTPLQIFLAREAPDGVYTVRTDAGIALFKRKSPVDGYSDGWSIESAKRRSGLAVSEHWKDKTATAEDSDRCAACDKNVSCVMCVPCLHVSYCAACVRAVAMATPDPRCPLCWNTAKSVTYVGTR